MQYYIDDFFDNGSLWCVLATICYIFHAIQPLLDSHVKNNKSQMRNNHELSLLRCAERVVADVARLADASPADRESLGLTMIFDFANKRHIPVNDKLAKSFYNKALSDFKLKGGKFNKPSQTVHVMPDGTVKEDGAK